MTAPSPYLTPPRVAALLRVKADKVLYWIHTGKLTAINVSDASRPRFRISQDALDTFLRSREVQQPPRVRRRHTQPEGGPLDRALGEKLAKCGKARLAADGKWYRVWHGQTLFV